MHTKLVFWLILAGICANLSCNVLKNPLSGHSGAHTPVEAAHPPNTVTVEIYIVRLSPYQNELVQQLWRETNEQSLPVQLRRELYAQGFRVGTLSHLMSPVLEQFINVSSEGVSDIFSGELQEFSAADVTRETGATRHTRQLLPGMRAVLKPFNDHNALPELFLFRQENGKMHGETYMGALGVLLVGAEANPDGSAQIQILPVIDHGTPVLRLQSVAGMVIQDASRPRHIFETLAVSQRLLPGHWIIMGTTTLDSAGAGKAFFARTDSVLEQRIVAIRLVRSTPAAGNGNTSVTLP